MPRSQRVFGVPTGSLVPGGGPVTATVTCSSGMAIVAGGYLIDFAIPADAPLLAGAYTSEDDALSSTTWQVTIVPLPNSGQQLSGLVQVQATALCVPSS